MQTLAAGDRIRMIGKLLELLKNIDADKLNAFVARMSELLTMILELFGQPPGAAILSIDEESQARAAFAHAASDGPHAQAIDIGAILALVKLVMQLVALVKGALPAAAQDQSSAA